jgi:hypothetical protein
MKSVHRYVTHDIFKTLKRLTARAVYITRLAEAEEKGISLV